jgi:hypothetical protein
VPDLEGNRLQEMRDQGAKGMSAARERSVGRRDFLVGLFRGRDSGSTGARAQAPAADAAQSADGSAPVAGEKRRLEWREEAGAFRDFTAPERTRETLADDSNLERVLKEMDDLTGIEEP